MTAALRDAGIPYAVVVHDAAAHPGEVMNFRIMGQYRLLRHAQVLFALSQHVEAGLRRQGVGEKAQRMVKLWHPPIRFGGTAPVMAHGGRVQLLYFGRLLSYKGLDLLADAVQSLGPEIPFQLRVCGDGQELGGLGTVACPPARYGRAALGRRG